MKATRYPLLLLLAVLSCGTTSCKDLKGQLPSVSTTFDEANLGGTSDEGTLLGEVRTENDPTPVLPGVWLLTDRTITWVVATTANGTQDAPTAVSLGRWVRLSDLQSWRNSLDRVVLTDAPTGAKIRGVIIHAVRGVINDENGTKSCDFDFSASGPVEVAVSNRHSYASDGKPLPRQTLPASAQDLGGGVCSFGGP